MPDLPAGVPGERHRRERERIEQAARDKAALMSRVSHELRTPLNAVLGFARLLEDDLQEPPSPRQRERLQRIAEAGTRLLALVDAMLELGRLDAEPEPWPTEALDAFEALERARVLAEPLARELRVGLGAEAPALAPAPALAGQGGAPDAVRVLAEPRRLGQALGLVLEHALVRASAHGAAPLGVRASVRIEGDQVVFVVHDPGPQLTPEQRLWLFESFVPTDKANTGDEANPVRLALARRLARAMGGELEAVTGADEATELHLALPRVPEGAAPEAPPLELLCVEDNLVNLQLVRELVALRPGVHLRVAEDAAGGVAAARAHPPHVLLLDLQLPDGSGLDVMRRLRSEPATAACCYIALSADAVPGHIEAALAAGFDAYWTKPIDFGHFLAGLDGLLAAPRPRRGTGLAAPAVHGLKARGVLEPS